MKPLLILAVLAGSSLLAQDTPTPDDKPKPPAGENRRGFGPPGMMAERKIVKQFDKDGDKRLDKSERAEARDFLKKNLAQRRGIF